MVRQFFLYNKQYTAKGAIGFYVAHLVAVCVFGVSLMLLYVFITGRSDETSLLQLGTAISFLSSLYVSFRILEEKKRFKNISFLLIAFASGICALVGGSLLGLIPAAILSTKK